MSVNSKNSQISAYERHCNEIKTPFASQCLLAVIKKRITRTLKKNIYIKLWKWKRMVLCVWKSSVGKLFEIVKIHKKSVGVMNAPLFFNDPFKNQLMLFCLQHLEIMLWKRQFTRKRKH